MNTKPSALKQVLFVDDSPKFLQKLRTKMPTWSHANWDMSFASDASKAFAILETKQVDLIVIDLGVSDMESVQFLKLVHQKHPHIRKAILTSFLEQSARRECLQSGADMYLIKPKRTNGFEAIFHSLNQLFTLSQEGFRGLLRTISLTDLIQLECLNARSSVLEISADKQFGRVFIKNGSIIHAQAGSKTGVDAFIRLMHMAGGDFNLKPFVDPGARTIEMSCDRLLLEASHAVDRGLAQEQVESSPESNTTWFRNVASEANPRSTSGSQMGDSSIESINFLQMSAPASDPTDFFPASVRNPYSSMIGPVNLDTIINLTDELIANRSHLDLKILDLAVLKEELNSCKSRLMEVIGQMRECVETTQEDANQDGNNIVTPLSRVNFHGNSAIAECTSQLARENTDDLTSLTSFIRTLNEICDDTSNVVGQLDGCFAKFTEDSGSFNETSAKLQSEIERINEAFVTQK
jgi:CheY-like chemotaxis protein